MFTKAELILQAFFCVEALAESCRTALPDLISVSEVQALGHEYHDFIFVQSRGRMLCPNYIYYMYAVFECAKSLLAAGKIAIGCS